MSIAIWKIISRGVLPNGKKQECYEFIVVEDNFHDREANDYITIASDPLEKEDIEQLIAGDVELIDFELTEDVLDDYSDADWQLAEKVQEENWHLILRELD